MKTKHGLLFGFAVIAIAAMFTLAGCKTEDDGGSSGSSKVPAELKGHWLRDSDGTERYLAFTDSGWDTDSSSYADAEKDASWVITSAVGNKVDYQSKYYPQVDTQGSFEWAVSGTTLTISNSSVPNYLSDGTYTKGQ